MMRVEGTEKREKLVTKLVEKIKKEYEEAKNFLTLCIVDNYTENSEFDDDLLQSFSIRSTVLCWLKYNIINNNGFIFRRVREIDKETDKIFYYVDEETVEILLFYVENIVTYMETFIYRYTDLNYYDSFNYNDLQILFEICKSNFSTLIAEEDRMAWQKNKEKMYKNLEV